MYLSAQNDKNFWSRTHVQQSANIFSKAKKLPTKIIAYVKTAFKFLLTQDC